MKGDVNERSHPAHHEQTGDDLANTKDSVVADSLRLKHACRSKNAVEQMSQAVEKHNQSGNADGNRKNVSWFHSACVVA